MPTTKKTVASEPPAEATVLTEQAYNSISPRELLAEPFPQEMLRYHQGKKLTYIPVAEVIARMNRVLGVDGWNSEVVRIWREDDQPDWVLAHVRVTATIHGRTVFHDGVGGQQVKKLRSGSGVVDLGDEYKGAMSDALKKACQGFGVGIDLARTDGALAIEESYATPASDITTNPASSGNAMADAVSAETWAKFQEAMKTLSANEKKAVREWWTANYGDYGNPSADISTEEQIAALLGMIAVIRLDVTPVDA
jgi:Rad52/22 family double-strand break repair protein